MNRPPIINPAFARWARRRVGIFLLKVADVLEGKKAVEERRAAEDAARRLRSDEREGGHYFKSGGVSGWATGSLGEEIEARFQRIEDDLKSR